MIDVFDKSNMPSELWVVSISRIRKGLGPLRIVPTIPPEESGIKVFYAAANGKGRDALYSCHECYYTEAEANKAYASKIFAEESHERRKHQKIMEKLSKARSACGMPPRF